MQLNNCSLFCFKSHVFKQISTFFEQIRFVERKNKNQSIKAVNSEFKGQFSKPLSKYKMILIIRRLTFWLEVCSVQRIHSIVYYDYCKNHQAKAKYCTKSILIVLNSSKGNIDRVLYIVRVWAGRATATTNTHYTSGINSARKRANMKKTQQTNQPRTLLD